jgi:hypothetical protein
VHESSVRHDLGHACYVKVECVIAKAPTKDPSESSPDTDRHAHLERRPFLAERLVEDPCVNVILALAVLPPETPGTRYPPDLLEVELLP